MATTTTNLGLTKPAYGESADIAVINTNMDTIDTAVAGKVTAPSGTVTADTAVVFDGTTGKLVKSSGKTLGTACAKGYTDSSSASAIGTGTSLPTERDVYYGLPKINNAHNYTSDTSIYAPTGGGTSGQILKANGATSTPTWINQSSITAGACPWAGVTGRPPDFGFCFSEVLNLGIDMINKCICLKETWYQANVDGYLFVGGVDPYTGFGLLRIGTDKTHYFQMNFFYNDINSNTLGAGAFGIPVKANQYFYAHGLERQPTYGEGMTGFVIGSDSYNANSNHSAEGNSSFWFIPARSSDVALSKTLFTKK